MCGAFSSTSSLTCFLGVSTLLPFCHILHCFSTSYLPISPPPIPPLIRGGAFSCAGVRMERQMRSYRMADSLEEKEKVENTGRSRAMILADTTNACEVGKRSNHAQIRRKCRCFSWMGKDFNVKMKKRGSRRTGVQDLRVHECEILVWCRKCFVHWCYIGRKNVKTL